MDPNANLEEQLELVQEILKADLTDCDAERLLIQGQRLAELITALDHWIVMGGFIPGRWSK